MVLIIITCLIKYFEQFADDDGLAGLDVSVRDDIGDDEKLVAHLSV